MTADQDAARAVAWSRQLAQAHAALRRQLRGVQAGLGHADAGDELLAHCLAFCSALTAHHEGEDGGLFAELLRVRPDLRDTVGKLAEDHRLIAGILANVGELAAEAADAPDGRREAIQRELAGLAAIAESHFAYEERAIGNALDDRAHEVDRVDGVRRVRRVRQVQDTGWTAAVFDFKA